MNICNIFNFITSWGNQIHMLSKKHFLFFLCNNESGRPSVTNVKFNKTNYANQISYQERLLLVNLFTALH